MSEDLSLCLCPLCRLPMTCYDEQIMDCENPTCLIDELHSEYVAAINRALAAAEQRGWNRRGERDARLSENVNPASGKERVNNLPGGDAMGAIIEYRDKIRALPYEPTPEAVAK